MGQGYTLRCTQCHKTIEITEGIGMAFPSEQEKTIAEILKTGEPRVTAALIKAFPQEAAVDGELRVWQCRTCGKIENTADLSVWMVKNEPHIHCHICGEPEDERIYRWAPVCPHCQEKMKPGIVRCPDCGGKLEDTGTLILWD